MTMISESGAIRDVSEIAAGLTAEEEARIESASLEELIEEIGTLEDDISALPEELVDELNISPAMESLLAVVTSLRESGSISRIDAVSIQSMTASMEGFGDIFNKMPITSFTEMPSKVNFDASMEGIASNVARAVIEAIKKAVAWIRDNLKKAIASITGNTVKARATDVLVKKTAPSANIGKFQPELFQPDTFEPRRFLTVGINNQVVKQGNDGIVFVTNRLAERLSDTSKLSSMQESIEEICKMYLKDLEDFSIDSLNAPLDKMLAALTNTPPDTDSISSKTAAIRSVLTDLRGETVLTSPDDMIPVLTKNKQALSVVIRSPSYPRTVLIANTLKLADKTVDDFKKSAEHGHATKEELDEISKKINVHKSMSNVLMMVSAADAMLNKVIVMFAASLVESGVSKQR